MLPFLSCTKAPRQAISIKGIDLGVGGGGAFYVSVGRDVPPKGARFSGSIRHGGIFHCTNSGKGL